MIWSFGAGDIVVEGSRTSHASELASIHKDCFPRGWTASEFIHLLESDNVRGMQARRPATMFLPPSPDPRGFVLTRIAGDEAEILTIGVAKSARRYGLGKALMRAVMNDLYADRVPTLFLEVDETNAAAIKLYNGLGFTKVGERKAYYSAQDGEENEGQNGGNDQAARTRALVMRCDLS